VLGPTRRAPPLQLVELPGAERADRIRLAMGTDIEALKKDAKHGTALRHLPSANRQINAVWMHAALLGCAIAAWMQELAGTDNGNGRGRFTVARFRREVICTPARLVRQAGIILLRLPPGGQLLAFVLPRLQSQPGPSG